jgi:predicted Ser/Thr protein kinase
LAAVEFKTGQLFGSKSKEANERDLIIKVSRYFVDYAAGAMKGPVHKLTQLMLNLAVLPAEAAENFKSVLWSKQIVPEKAMRRVLEEEFGRKTEDIFAEFDFSPIGVGSVSQVYRARLKSGEEVAVKIQFPDLEKIIEQDLAIFSRIFTSVSWLFPRQDVTAINEHLRQMIKRELDFREEAEVQEKFRLTSERGMRWRVPKVHLELSSRRVMTSEYVQGSNFYQFAEQASPAERLEAAKAISDFALRSIIEAGLVCVDPHPANLIFRDGKVYVIDFGFFMPATPSFVQMVQQLILAHHPIDIDQLFHILQDAKQFITPSGVSGAEVREFGDVLVRQLNWRSSGDPDLQRRFNDFFFKRGFNKAFGSEDPASFLGYIGYIQSMRSISKLNAAQPDSWYTELCDDLAVHIQGDGCSAACRQSEPRSTWGGTRGPEVGGTDATSVSA